MGSWDPIVKYIKDQHSAYLRKELTAQRDRYIQDTRIHCCLFFIQPSGHAYCPLLLLVLILVLSPLTSLCSRNCRTLSMSFPSLPSPIPSPLPSVKPSNRGYYPHSYSSNVQIKAEVAFHNIKMYPYDNDELDEEERALNTQIKVPQPPRRT